MKNLGRLIVVAILLTLSAGCIRSLHPLYTDQDVIFNSDLVGCWSQDDSKDTWEFSKQNENEYQLVYTDKEGKSGTFVVHLLRIDGKMFLDLFPGDSELKHNAFYQRHILPVHTIAYVKQIRPTLQMIFPDPNWLKKLIAGNPEAIRHEKIHDEIILTASTKALQKFWLKHLDTKGAFGEPSNMKRKKTAVPEEQPKKADASDGK